MIKNILKYSNICVYGLDEGTASIVERLFAILPVNIISDGDIRKLKLYKTGLTKIHLDALSQIEGLFVIVVASFARYKELKVFFDLRGIPSCVFNQIGELNYSYPIVDLSTIETSYKDHLGNTIEIGPFSKFHNASYIIFGEEGSGFVSKNNKLLIDFGCTGPMRDKEEAAHINIRFNRENSKVIIGDKVWIRSLNINMFGDNYFEIGGCSSVEEVSVVYANEGIIKIGRNCMLSNEIDIWQTDGHPIYDESTGNRINTNKNIYIKDHVWLGRGVQIMGVADISTGTIVGANSVTASKFDNDRCVIAGNPAKVLRNNIAWSRDVLSDSMYQSIFETREYKNLDHSDVVLWGDFLIQRGQWKKIANDYKILNLGEPWTTVTDVLIKVQGLVKVKPRILILMIGTSDFILSNSASPVKIFNEICELLEILKSYNIKPIINSIIEYSYPAFRDKLENVKNFNKMLEGYCISNNIKICNLNVLLMNDVNSKNAKNYFEVDGLTINDAAYEIWENHLLKFVKSID